MSLPANKHEILAPAGDWERLQMAVTYGADAVYLAGKDFGMRAAANNFTPEQMEQAVAYCHRAGVRVYVTINSVLHNRQAEQIPAFLEQLEQFGADAAIITDIGLIGQCQKYAPSLDIHISTQCGVANYMTASAFYDMGAKRVILAREMTLDEITELRAKTPRELEIETFVHGAMCVSFSGRCLLSAFMAGRDANNGACAQPCRWKYHLMEERRGGQLLEITEDGGTHIMNSRDLCMIEHLPALMQAGVTSMKIEGRMKSAYYAAVVTNAYRHAMDAAERGEPLSPVWRDEVNKVSHRPYSTGFFFDPLGPGQHYADASYITETDVVAMVESCDENGMAVLTQRNKFSRGDALELLTPGSKPVAFTAADMTDGEGNPIESAPHAMMRLSMPLPTRAPALSIVRKVREDVGKKQ